MKRISDETDVIVRLWRVSPLILLLMLTRQGATTPLVIARYKQGFVMGSNQMRSQNRNGQRTCKVHIAGGGVVLRATNNVAKYNAAGSFLFDLDEELSQDLSNKNLGLDDLRTAVIESTERSISRAMTFDPPTPPPGNPLPYLYLPNYENRFLIVGLENGKLSIRVVRIDVLYTDQPWFLPVYERTGLDKKTGLNRFDLEVGEWLEWDTGDDPQVYRTGPSKESAIAAVKDHLEKSGMKDGKKRPGFEEPYTIVDFGVGTTPKVLGVEPDPCRN
jgi:hypothetical protein